MLVLSRKKNESVVIDGRIRIEVLKVKGNTIRLGISAPKDVKVLRGELDPVNGNNSQEPSKDEVRNSLVAMLAAGQSETDAMDLTRLPNPFAVAQAV